MATKDEIEHFLKDFKYKLSFWGLFMRSDRDKNFKTLTELELAPRGAGVFFVASNDDIAIRVRRKRLPTPYTHPARSLTH